MKAQSLLALAGLSLAACVSPGEPPSEPLPVPFTVSDYYSPDGFYGDGELEGYLALTHECPSRPAGAQGDCVTITYKPGPKGFAGIFWQYPHNNWGDFRGHRIAQGATRITFAARGGRGGTVINVGAGIAGANMAYKDSFKLEEVQVPLQEQWTKHEVPFRGANYGGQGGVLGAFTFSLPAADNDETTVFYLDDIRWDR
jgi:hypothetical protein